MGAFFWSTNTLGVVKYLNTLNADVEDYQHVIEHVTRVKIVLLWYRKFANFCTLFCEECSDDFNLKSCDTLLILKIIYL